MLAQDPLPPFAASIKDGYAVCARDGPGEYPIVGEATAGRIPPFGVAAGSVAYITTGAPVPPGADAVVMVEETELLPQRDGIAHVRIGQRVEPGADVRPVGYDVAAEKKCCPLGCGWERRNWAAGDRRPGVRADCAAASASPCCPRATSLRMQEPG